MHLLKCVEMCMYIIPQTLQYIIIAIYNRSVQITIIYNYRLLFTSVLFGYTLLLTSGWLCNWYLGLWGGFASLFLERY